MPAERPELKPPEFIFDIVCSNGHPNGTESAFADDVVQAMEKVLIGLLPGRRCQVPGCNLPLKIGPTP